MELNKIYLGDCYELIKEIPDKSVDLVIIDPPYQFVNGGDGHSEIAKRRRRLNESINSLDSQITRQSEKEKADYLNYIKDNGKNEKSELLRIKQNIRESAGKNLQLISQGIDNEIFDQLVRVMKKINIYVWGNKNQLKQYIDYFVDAGCNIDLLTWHKLNPMPTCNNTYLSDTEYCLFAREGGVKLYGSFKTKNKYWVTPKNIEDKRLYKHPTIKPLPIIKNLVINSSQENEVILDCFCGSGTTCVAAKELNRNYIGIEMNEEYWKIANDRLNGINVKGEISLL